MHFSDRSQNVFLQSWQWIQHVTTRVTGSFLGALSLWGVGCWSTLLEKSQVYYPQELLSLVKDYGLHGYSCIYTEPCISSWGHTETDQDNKDYMATHISVQSLVSSHGNITRPIKTANYNKALKSKRRQAENNIKWSMICLGGPMGSKLRCYMMVPFFNTCQSRNIIWLWTKWSSWSGQR